MLRQQTNQVAVPPMDRYNQKLVENLHPPQWINPKPASCYNLVVIGGGTAGLVTAAGAALFGAKVALVEKHLLGGDCTNVGCVPSKTMIRSARAVAAVKQAKQYGVTVSGVAVDFSAVMERLRRIRAQISENDSAQHMAEEYGVQVFLGEGRFLDRQTVAVADQKLRFKKAVIATGSSPVKLPIDGLESVGYLTNETVFSLTQRPQRLVVIGGGYIGCELAQTFQRLGSQVTLLQKSSRLLTSTEAEAAQIVEQALRREGVNVILKAETQQVAATDGKQVTYRVDGQLSSVTADEILVAVGRSPHVQGLSLEQVGVEYSAKQGININEYLQTSNPRIYAVGDVAMQSKFTHAADAAARIVIQNALFAPFGIGRKKLSTLTIPWCTYTQPEIAHVGISAQEAEERAANLDTFCVPMDDIDRAVIDGETAGFTKIYLKKGTDKILGATIVAAQAGETINVITLAMQKELGLGAIAATIFPYPTQAEIVRKVADAYSLSRFTPAIKKLASIWLQLRRR
ncbi:MAG: mercuric reductase [Cyanophyceae cyanobacterium]